MPSPAWHDPPLLPRVPGGELSAAAINLWQLEPEIGFVMGADLPARADGTPHTASAAAAAVSSVVLCIELCGKRVRIPAQPTPCPANTLPSLHPALVPPPQLPPLTPPPAVRRTSNGASTGASTSISTISTISTSTMSQA